MTNGISVTINVLINKVLLVLLIFLRIATQLDKYNNRIMIILIFVCNAKMNSNTAIKSAAKAVVIIFLLFESILFQFG